MSSVAEIYAKLGFEVDQVQLNQVVNILGKLNLSSVLAAFGVKELYDGIKDIMEVSTATALGMRNFTEETGLSNQQMKKWTNLAEQMGIKGDVVASSLGNLQKKLVGMKLGTDNSLLTPFYILNQAGAGITGKEDPFTLIQKIGQGFKNLSPEVKSTVSGMMGFNEEMIILLNHIDEIKNAGNVKVLSENQINELVQFNKASKELGQSWQYIINSFGASLAPALDGLAKGTEWIIKMTQESKALQAVITAIGLALISAALVAGGPWTVLLGLVTSLAYWIGILIHNFDEIKAKFPNVDLNQFKSNIGGVIEGAGKQISTAANNVQTSVNNVFNIVSNDAHAVAKAVDERLGKHLGDAKYQQPLASY